MSLKLSLEAKEFDVRLRDKYLAQGTVTDAKVDTYLNSLPDDSANAIMPETEEDAE